MINRKFTENFNEQLKKHGKTAIDVSRDLKIPKSVVYEWKSGERMPKADKLTMLAVYFGVTVSYLLGCEEEGDSTSIYAVRPDENETKLLNMLHAAREVSPEDYVELIETFRKNADLYLRAKGIRLEEKDESDGNKDQT